MKPMQAYFNGEKVKTIFNTIDKSKVDIAVRNKMIRNVNRSKLMVSMEDAEKQINDLETAITKAMNFLKETFSICNFI